MKYSNKNNFTVFYLRSQVGAESDQFPLDSQIRVSLPFSSYPSLHVYTALSSTTLPEKLTAPLVGLDKAAHWTTKM